MISEIKIKATAVKGVTEITADGWDGRILRMSHNAYEDWRERGKLETPAIYMLYADHFDRAQHGNELYIGHTANAQTRIDQHVGSKYYWSAVLIFSSASDWINVAHTQNVEFQFINLAKIAGRYQVMNGNDSSPTHLGEVDKTKLDDFLLGAKDVMRLAGIDIFEINLDSAFTQKNKHTKTPSAAVLRIKTIKPKCTVTIAAGSVLWGYDDKIVQTAALTGVTYSKTDYTHSFAEDVEIELESIADFYKLFGKSIYSFKNACGIKLTEVLEKAQKN